jgi:hypothetical protein
MRKKRMLILLVISHLYDQLPDLHHLTEDKYCCPILLNLGRMKGEEDDDEDSEEEDSDDEDGLQVLVVDEGGLCVSKASKNIINCSNP